jgi:SSS family transporter
MEELRNPIILTSVALYMATCIGFGIWALRRTNSARDFFMAGRSLGVFVTAMAVFTSTLSGFAFVGGPGLVYAMGMSSVWIVISSTIGFSISFFLLAKRLRLFAQARDPISLPDAVAARYRSETSRFLAALAILLGVMGYLATQILAMAMVLQSILERTAGIGTTSLVACVAISTAVLVFYCVTGGIVASVYTDLVQGGVMVIASLLVFATALHAIDGGAAGAVAVLQADDPESIGPWGTLGMMGCLSWFFMFALGGVGQPHVVTKFMMNKNVRDARRILPVSIISYSIAALLWISIGLVMRALVLQGAHAPLEAADAAAPEFLQAYAHPILAGVVFAGLFAAIMSTADSFLNIGAAAVVHDIPRAFRGRSLQRELYWARIATVAIGIAGAAFALYSHYVNARLIALLGAFGWGTFAAALVPAVAIGFNWKRASALAANVAIAVSLVVNFGIEVFDIAIPHGIHGGTVAMVLSITLFFGISLLSPRPKLDPDIEAVMDV